MVVKVCGIKSTANVEMISKTDVEMVGLNFYPPSSRYIDPSIPPSRFDKLGDTQLRVGVFVNETIEVIRKLADDYKLDYIQLHGDEDNDFCKAVAKEFKVIKVVRVDEQTDWQSMSDFDFVDYMLFDTATINYGGSGKKFDWSILHRYSGDIPFLLSGGIGPGDAEAVSAIDHPKFVGIDINSKFESSPAEKDENLLLPFLNKVRLSST